MQSRMQSVTEQTDSNIETILYTSVLMKKQSNVDLIYAPVL